MYAPAATYLLAELSVHDALPMMGEIYAMKEHIPVNRLFLLYAMHRLATTHPRQGLSPDAATALDAYLMLAKGLSAAEVARVPSWCAAVEETDFRNTILHEDIGLDKQPMIEVAVYPELPNSRRYGELKLAPEADLLFAKLQSFIKSAYPQTRSLW